MVFLTSVASIVLLLANTTLLNKRFQAPYPAGQPFEDKIIMPVTKSFSNVLRLGGGLGVIHILAAGPQSR
jgi:hypothetical protein